MRKIFYLALPGLLALLILTGVVSAGSSALVNISGTVGYLEVTATPGNLTFGNMIAVNVYNTSTILEVESSFPEWRVDASDQNTGLNSGFMLSGSTPLTNDIILIVDQTPIAPWYNIMSGQAGTTSEEIEFHQAVVNEDTPGDYTITIVFTAYPL